VSIRYGSKRVRVHDMRPVLTDERLSLPGRLWLHPEHCPCHTCNIWREEPLLWSSEMALGIPVSLYRMVTQEQRDEYMDRWQIENEEWSRPHNWSSEQVQYE
jgi:hypothetical protein